VQIRQVIINLLMNASEALADQEGVISLSLKEAQSQDSRRVPSSDSSAKGYVRLEISDTGCGMTKETQGKAFDPFFTTKGKGRGLGLAAVQGIVRTHGGTIRVQSRLGRGTRFEILLPAVDALHASGRANAEPINALAGKALGTVLLVEDEELLRRVVSHVFRDKGFTVIEAASGETAVALFQANPSGFDAVLLDMTLPAMSGLEVFHELRRLRPDIRVVLTTAYNQDFELTSDAAEKPWCFIRKPYRLAELSAVLERACAQEPA
jgi:two-component system, cell cycle sensor histidine kinase and response regulator CckA